MHVMHNSCSADYPALHISNEASFTINSLWYTHLLDIQVVDKQQQRHYSPRSDYILFPTANSDRFPLYPHWVPDRLQA